MKQSIKFIVFLLILTIIMPLSACSFSKDNKYIDVEIQHNERTESVTFYTKAYASQIKITPDYVEDKILLGYYDTQDDNGTMYFDYLGNLTTNSWKESYPRKLYAVYKPCDISKIYQSSILRDENPYSATYKYTGWTNWEFLSFSVESIRYAQNNDYYSNSYAELAQFIHSNSNKKIRLTLHFSLKQVCSCCNIKLIYRIKVGSESFDEHRYEMSQSWNTTSIAVDIFAKQLKGNTDTKNYIYLQMNTLGNQHVDVLYTVKNIYYTVQVIE
ncbi:MAG: hypothetical protein IJW64_05175 [Clostridia bacterium]|nr:hypothetical protein [Clostridia bacterium]